MFSFFFFFFFFFFFCIVWVVFVWFWCVLGDVSTDPERINHMPICRNLAGNQKEQNMVDFSLKFST